MGKSCISFEKLGDLPLPPIEELVAGSTSPAKWIAIAEAARKR